jgi:hypothetical protein
MSATAHEVTTRLVAASVAAVLAGCGASGPDAAPDVTEAVPVSTVPALPELGGVTGELILTRQRDLLDRGLINVLVRNESGSSMLLSDVELVADFFDGRAVARRTISVRSGRQVAIQVPYGTADDCDTERPVAAELALTLTTDDDAVPSTARLGLAGTDLLDAIRVQQCTTRRFDAAVRTRFEGTDIVDGAVVTRLVIEPTGSATDLIIDGVSGTVLVGVRTDEASAGTRLAGDPVAIPLTFVVNRCDPHALAEVTKRYGLTLAVSDGGGEPADVDVALGELVDDLEAAVAQCTADAAGG